jgi:hypothetical protein
VRRGSRGGLSMRAGLHRSCGDTIAADRNVAHEDVRLAAHYGLNSDIALGSVLCQKSTPASRPNGYFEVAVIISL